MADLKDSYGDIYLYIIMYVKKENKSVVGEEAVSDFNDEHVLKSILGEKGHGMREMWGRCRDSSE